MKRLCALLVMLAAGLMWAGCGGATEPADVSQPAVDESRFIGGDVLPLEPAPEIGLSTPEGATVRIGDLKGKVVMVTFIYARCPDICNLLVDSMRAAKKSLGADAAKVAMVAVSVDPEGDTPALVKDFKKRHRVPDLSYVIGTRSQLEPVWKAWAVAAQENFDNPALVEHSGVIWLLDAQGNRAVYFPVSQVNAKDLAHDLRELLAG